MKNFKILLIFFSTVLTCLSIVSAQDKSDDQQQRNKLMGCLNLSKARVMKDDLFVDEIVDLMIIRTGGDKKEKTDKLISIILLTCYKRISPLQASKLAEADPKDFDPMTEELKDLLQLEKWKDLYEHNNQDELDRELGHISKSMEEFRNEDAARQTLEDDLFDDNFIKRDEGEKSIGIFGISLKDISATTKNFIGFSFLGLIVLLVVYGLKAIKKPENKKVNRRKIN